MADDIAMLLTDVSRSVGNVELFLQKQTGVRRISKSSFKRSSSSVESPPPILEVSCLLFSRNVFKPVVQSKLIRLANHIAQTQFPILSLNPI